MHGVGHPLGLDVHDLGLVTEPMQEGWVMTVEPAIYIPDEGFAVRRGNWWQVEIRVPISRVQHLDLKHGPLERSLNLSISQFKPFAGIERDKLAGDDTFAQVEVGMDPKHMGYRAIDRVVGRRWYRNIVEQMDKVAQINRYHVEQFAKRLVVERRIQVEARADDVVPLRFLPGGPLLENVRVVDFLQLEVTLTRGGPQPANSACRPDLVEVDLARLDAQRRVGELALRVGDSVDTLVETCGRLGCP